MSEIQKRQSTIADFIQTNLSQQIAKVLPQHLTADKMVKLALGAIRKDPKLGLCSQASFGQCIMELSELGLSMNTPLGEAYLIPRENKKGGLDCTYIIGYQGYIALARRSGDIKKIYADVVRDGDYFIYERGLEEKLVHRPGDQVNATVTHAYAIAWLVTSDQPVFVVLNKSQIGKRKERSPTSAKSYSPWSSDYEAMCKKSAVRALWPWLPRSVEMAKAFDYEVSKEVIDVDEKPASKAASILLQSTNKIESANKEIEEVAEKDEENNESN